MRKALILLSAIMLAAILLTSCTTSPIASTTPAAQQAASPSILTETTSTPQTSTPLEGDDTDQPATATHTEIVASTPDKVVEKMFKAAYDIDVISFFECWNPESETCKFIKNCNERHPFTSRSQIYSSMSFDSSFEKINVISTKVDQSDKTTAKVTAQVEAWIGEASMKTSLVYKLVKKEGKWYITD